jgi:large subunit ribosomal protein L30
MNMVEKVDIEKEKSLNKTEQVSKKELDTKNEKNSNVSNSFIAVIRIRGGRKIDGSIKKTLSMLNLNNQHNMVILPNKSNYIGMLKKSKDYITWGLISSDFKKKLELGEIVKLNKELNNEENKKVYRLHPPIGGYEKKGIKMPYSTGGVLGNRGEKIIDLIKRMISK